MTNLLSARWPTDSSGFVDSRSGPTIFCIIHWRSRQSEIALLSLESGETRILFEGHSPQLTYSGHLLFARGSTIWAAAFDHSLGKVIGEIVPVVEGAYQSIQHAVEYAISDEGTLIYWTEPIRSASSELIWKDRSGRTETIVTHQDQIITNARISPDGDRIVLDDQWDTWIYSIKKNRMIRLNLTKQRARHQSGVRTGNELYSR